MLILLFMLYCFYHWLHKRPQQKYIPLKNLSLFKNIFKAKLFFIHRENFLFTHFISRRLSKNFIFQSILNLFLLPKAFLLSNQKASLLLLLHCLYTKKAYSIPSKNLKSSILLIAFSLFSCSLSWLPYPFHFKCSPFKAFPFLSQQSIFPILLHFTKTNSIQF